MSSPPRTIAWAITVVMFGFAPWARAEIYKCVEGGRTAYQSWPCAASASETTLALSPSPRVDVAPRANAPPPPTARPRGPWRHTTLSLGMSDDEVLNLSGWGRPQRVARTRMPHQWREEWIYGEGTSAERRLTFANARLVDISRAQGEDRLAGLPARAY